MKTNISILYAIWLNENCTMLYDFYDYQDNLYGINSLTDMQRLYDIFIESDYYKNSI